MEQFTSLQTHQTILQWTKQKQGNKNTEPLQVSLKKAYSCNNRLQLLKLQTIQS